MNITLKNRAPLTKELELRLKITDQAGQVAARCSIPVILFGEEETVYRKTLAIQQPHLWSAETPDLYTCAASLVVPGSSGGVSKALDTYEENFGIRTIVIDSVDGFSINGTPRKLRGACIHHDSGLLGAATYEAAQFRQVKILKDAGFNAIRMAHHPMAPAMLRACDALGMYVMDEAFDVWNQGKSFYDYALFFEHCWEDDLTAMIEKDYNHPSVIMYSLGNEIAEIGRPGGVKVCQRLNTFVKNLDPGRYTLSAVNGAFIAGESMSAITDSIMRNETVGRQQKGNCAGNVNDFMTLMQTHMKEIVCHDEISRKLDQAYAVTDIAGYNYMDARYKTDVRNYPDRVIVGSETCPPAIAHIWPEIQKFPQIIGDFTWTGWDYIGEAGGGIPSYEEGEGGFSAAFPAQLSYQGDIDITGFRRPMSYLREIVFGLRQDPYIAVQDPSKFSKKARLTPWILSDTVASWTWNGCEGLPVSVEVYALGDEVELFINNRSVGKKTSELAAGYRVLFETIYEPGVIEAVAYKAGKVIGKMSLKTAGEDRHSVLCPEPELNDRICSDNTLVFIPVMLCDSEGNVVTDDNKTLHVSVEGEARLLGFGSGNPKPLYNYNQDVTETFYGRALIIAEKVRCGSRAKIRIRTDDAMEGECMI